jgi:glycerophosphoryl diester phosphodiesterase
VRLLRDGGPALLVGHRGAAATAPENTLRAFDAALAAGVDAIEFDVLDLPGGPLVLAHSDDLYEVSHGAATGLVRGLALEELRAVAPALPTLDEALDWFEAHDVLLHADLKLTTRLDELCAALARFGVAHRAVVSSFHAPSLRAVARDAPGVLVAAIRRRGLAARTVVSSFHVPSLLAVAAVGPEIAIGRTYPEDRYGVAQRRALRPVLRAGTLALRRALAARVATMIERAGASALMLHHAVVSQAAVSRAHARGAAVWAWTVDDPVEAARVLAAGVDAVITNDPTELAATLRP